MRAFADEFVGTLITPTHRDLWKKEKRPTLEMLERFRREIAPIFGGVQAAGVEDYARHFLAHPDIFGCVEPFRQSILSAFAEGTRSAPLCDQLCFLNEWLEKNEPDAVHRGSENGTSTQEG